MIMRRRFIKDKKLDEKQIILKTPTLRRSVYLSPVRYKYPSGRTDRMVIESKWFLCPNLSNMIKHEIDPNYELHVRITENHPLKHILRKLEDELLSRKQSIIESVIQNANIDDWKNSLFTTKKYIRDSQLLAYNEYWIFHGLNKAVIKQDGKPISLNSLVHQRVGRCGIKIQFKVGCVCFGEPSSAWKAYTCICDIVSLEIDLNPPLCVNPNDPDVMLVVEI
jgi:hypothetical protein